MLLDYCMFISFLGVILLVYWGFLTATGSELMYLSMKSRSDGAISLFFAAFVYALIFGICYYFKYYAKDGNNDVRKYIQKTQARFGNQSQQGIELRTIDPQ